MNPELLIAHFNRVSDAPDAVPRLRRFIFDLAMRGKLAKQDPNDEPAIELLKRIRVQKTHMTKAGRITSPLPRIELNEFPFDAPAGWEFARISTLCELENGDRSKNYPSRDEFTTSGIPFINAGHLQSGNICLDAMNYIPESKFNLLKSGKVRSGDILFCLRGSLGKSAIVSNISRGAIASSLVIIRLMGQINPNFVLQYLFSTLAVEMISRFDNGTAQPNLSSGDLGQFVFPLPPLAEQHRIVTKVNELMALCDRLEAAQVDRDSRGDRLTAASHHHLNNGADTDDLRRHAHFFIDHLPRVTARPDQIKQLRQTILNLAVRGQLVPRNPNDEPASELLKRIRAEKAQLVKEGKLKHLDSTASPMDSDFPFPIPTGWSPATLQTVCLSVTDGDHLPPPKADRGIPFLVIGNVRSQTVTFDGCRYVSEQYYNALDSIRRPQKGDILYTLVGSYGIPVMVIDDRPFCVQRHIGILRPSRTINARFLSRVLESKWVFGQASAWATGIAQKTIPLAGLRKISIPLPPLAEQHRIVAKVDELMTLCDQLEGQLATGQTESSHLLEAVLHHALSDLQVSEESLPQVLSL